MKISDMSGAKVGDRVFVSQGPEPREDGTNAVIARRYKKWERLLQVRNDNDEWRYYNLDGKSSKNDALPSLFWSMPEIIVPERPRRTVKKEVPVWPFKDIGNNQRVSAFLLTDDQIPNGPKQTVKVKTWENSNGSK